MVGAVFGRTVAAPEIILKQDSHLANAGTSIGTTGSSHLKSRDEGFLTVGTHLADGQL